MMHSFFCPACGCTFSVAVAEPEPDAQLQAQITQLRTEIETLHHLNSELNANWHESRCRIAELNTPLDQLIDDDPDPMEELTHGA